MLHTCMVRIASCHHLAGSMQKPNTLYYSKMLKMVYFTRSRSERGQADSGKGLGELAEYPTNVYVKPVVASK